MARRHLELTAERLPRWWGRFHAEHPEVTTHLEDGAVLLTSSDGTVARFTGWFPVQEISSEDDARTQLTVVPREIAIVLLRRGGYAIGLAHVGENGRRELRAHKSGTRYVQSRTAAGGWSQQRFARRRENQAEGLVRAAADHAVRVLAPLLTGASAGSHAGLAVGGDAFLIDGVLQDPRLTRLRGLPRREYPDVPDPRFKVLQEVVRRTALVSLAVDNP